MKRIKKLLLSVGLAATLALTAGTVAQVATAHNTSKAEAYTATQCRIEYRLTGTYPGYKVNVCYFDYNWWEESWMGGSHRDGWYYTPIPVYA